MNRRVIAIIGTAAAVAALASWTPTRTAAQGTGGSGFQGEPPAKPYQPKSGCPEDVGPRFESCAQEKMKTFKPPLTEDGKPDLRGYWARTFQSLTLEERGPDMPEHRKSNTVRDRAIIDPPTGPLPYQPWAAKQREENFQKYVDPLAMLYLPGGQRFPYISSGGYLFLQPRGKEEVVMLLEEIHMYRVIPTDGRPHIPASIKLYEGDPVGTWEGNTLVVDITNLNGETWFVQAGDFLSDAAHVTERWTLIDKDVIHVQSTIDDPKVFTQPWKFAVAMVRIQRVFPEFTELYEESSFEGDRDLPTMFKSHTRYPGFTGLPAAKGR